MKSVTYLCEITEKCLWCYVTVAISVNGIFFVSDYLPTHMYIKVMFLNVNNDTFSNYLYSCDRKKVPLMGQPLGFLIFPLNTFLYSSKLFKLTAPSNVSIIIWGVCKQIQLLCVIYFRYNFAFKLYY